jgi:hypothetical protein
MTNGAHDLDTVLRPKGESVRRQIAGETILVPIRGRTADMQSIFALNPTAAFIMERVDGCRTVGEILEETLGAFEVDRALALEHLEAFLACARANGLVEEVH